MNIRLLNLVEANISRAVFAPKSINDAFLMAEGRRNTFKEGAKKKLSRVFKRENE